jgi:hypothetical protein
MDFQTASGQEVFRRGSGFGFELHPEVYPLPGQVSLARRPLPHDRSPSAWYGSKGTGG